MSDHSCFMKRNLMKTLSRFLAASILVLLFCGCNQKQLVVDKDADLPKGPVYKLTNKGFITDWLVIGGFPNPAIDNPNPDGSYHLGFYKDYLEAIGGEKQAVLTPSTTVGFKDQDGKKQTAITQTAKAGGKGIVDLNKMFNEVDFKVAYAFCYIFSDKEQTVGIHFGSDDSAKVWVNGKLVNSQYVGRGTLMQEKKASRRIKRS